MTESIQLDVKLKGVVRREGKRWIAGCPSLNVYSQGRTREDAQRCLEEAVELWFESCLERGTLGAALQEVGFRPAPWGIPLTDRAEFVSVKQVSDAAIVGTPFELSISIPAYQAAAILQSQAGR
jgi:predicted RNase H-like HicB family nuclease